MQSALLVFLVISTTTLAFNPIPHFNLSKLFGTWNLTSYFDFSGDNNSTLCFQFNFDYINSTSFELKSYIYDTSDDGVWINGTIHMKYTSDPAEYDYTGIKYDVLYYKEENNYEHMILGANWTKYYYISQYFVYGLVRGPGPALDMSDVLISYNLIPIFNYNYFYINRGCYSSGLLPIPGFQATTLINTWNLIAVYDVVGYFAWPNVKNVVVKISKEDKMWVASFQGRYNFGSNFIYNSTFIPEKKKEGNLFGFQLNNGTSMVVNFAFDENNYILIAGEQSFAMLLSTNLMSANASMLSTFESKLAGLAGYSSQYVYAINNIPSENVEL